MAEKTVLGIGGALLIGSHLVARARGVQDWSRNVPYGEGFMQIINRCFANQSVASVKADSERSPLETVSPKCTNDLKGGLS